MAEEGAELPDPNRGQLNGTMGTRCRERIIRAQQRRAQDQLDGKGRQGYLAKWRKNYAQSGWWCDLCDFFSYFPDTACYECKSPRPPTEVLWKYAYRKEVRAEAVRNVEQAIKEDSEVETNYLIGKGKYTNAQAPEWLDSEDKDKENAHAYSLTRRSMYYQGRTDDLATESQKIAAYNMMVCMTEGAMENPTHTGMKGIRVGGNDEDIGDEVMREIAEEDAAEAAANAEAGSSKGQDPEDKQDRDFIEKLTSVPLLDKNNQFLSFEDKLGRFEKYTVQFTLHAIRTDSNYFALRGIGACGRPSSTLKNKQVASSVNETVKFIFDKP